jgi:hypothetical protein
MERQVSTELKKIPVTFFAKESTLFLRLSLLLIRQVIADNKPTK